VSKWVFESPKGLSFERGYRFNILLKIGTADFIPDSASRFSSPIPIIPPDILIRYRFCLPIFRSDTDSASRYSDPIPILPPDIPIRYRFCLPIFSSDTDSASRFSHPIPILLLIFLADTDIFKRIPHFDRVLKNRSTSENFLSTSTNIPTIIKSTLFKLEKNSLILSIPKIK